MTYLLPLAAEILTVNIWTLCRVTDPLQDGRFTRICPSHDEESELDLWDLRAGLFSIHWFVGILWKGGAKARAGLLGIHWFGARWSDRARTRTGVIVTHWFGMRCRESGVVSS